MIGFTPKLNDKLNYIVRLKTERNKAQDEPAEVRKELGLTKDESLLNRISEMKKTVDNQQKNG